MPPPEGQSPPAYAGHGTAVTDPMWVEDTEAWCCIIHSGQVCRYSYSYRDAWWQPLAREAVRSEELTLLHAALNAGLCGNYPWEASNGPTDDNNIVTLPYWEARLTLRGVTGFWVAIQREEGVHHAVAWLPESGWHSLSLNYVPTTLREALDRAILISVHGAEIPREYPDYIDRATHVWERSASVLSFSEYEYSGGTVARLIHGTPPPPLNDLGNISGDVISVRLSTRGRGPKPLPPTLWDHLLE